MSQTLALLTDRSFLIPVIESKLLSSGAHFSTHLIEDGRAQIQVLDDGHSGVVIRELDRELSEQEVADSENYPVPFKTLNSYSIRFHNLNFLNKIIRMIADDSRVWIHTDHDQVMSGHSYINRLDCDPDWDWRNESPNISV